MMMVKFRSRLTGDTGTSNARDGVDAREGSAVFPSALVPTSTVSNTERGTYRQLPRHSHRKSGARS
jgi:hypothetical protein